MMNVFFHALKISSVRILFFAALCFAHVYSSAKDLPPFNLRMQSTNSNPVLLGTGTADGIVDANPKTGSFNDTRVMDLLTLAYDHAKDTFLSANVNLVVKLHIQAWDKNNNTINLSNPAPTLKLSIRPFEDPVGSADKFVHYFKGAYKFEVTLDSIFVNGVSVTRLPNCFYVEQEIQITRFYDFTNASTNQVTINAFQLNDLDCDNQNDEIQINWATVAQAEEYELEWTFINDYSYAGLNMTLNPNVLNFDFRNNSTRITTKDNSYKVSLIYEKGYFLYRVRAVGRDYLNPGASIFSPWSLPDNGLVSSAISSSPNSVYHTTQEHEGSKNWQLSTSYAEEGKKKEVIKYFDGSLRNRQSVTKMNSDKNVIVGETVYDNQGRPAVTILPVPVDAPVCTTAVEASIKYYFNFNSDPLHNPYNRNDFDIDGNSTCTSIVTPMDSSLSGAAHYYSEANPNQNAQQAYLPNSRQYPFTQTEYTPDNTGRIRTQGGVGKEFQLGSDTSHVTKYFYGQPNQLQLDRLFGSEAGDASHYKKNIIFDVNGQASVTYLDQEGRTIITALAGNAPYNKDSTFMLSPIASSNNAVDTLTIDLFDKDAHGNSLLNAININHDAVVFNSQLLVEYNSLYNFTYNLRVDTLFDPCLRQNVCFNCVYDLTLKISDECGNDLIPATGCNSGQPLVSKTIGKFVNNNGQINFQSLTNCTSPDTFKYAFNCPIPLKPGNYTLTKTLQVNKQARDTIVKRYLDTTYNSCVKSLHNFQQAALANVDTNRCKVTCDSCAANLGKRDDFVSSGKGTTMMYDFLLQQCLEGCQPLSVCTQTYQQLLLDIYPSAQYGEYTNNSNVTLVSASTFPLSVFNITNSLPHRPNFGSTNSDWRFPRLILNGNVYNTYIDDNGNPSKIVITVSTVGINTVYSPDVTTPSLVVLDTTSGNFVTPPENLKYVGDFIAKWQDSWAPSLVVYHPEYPYYQACVGYSVKQTGDKQSSDAFDDLILNTNTFAAAVIAGFIKPNYLTLPANSAATNAKADNIFTQSNAHPYDPFVTNAYFNSYNSVAINPTMFSQLNGKFLNYITVNSVSYSMPEAAAIIARCGTIYNSVNTSCTYFGTNITINPVINDSVRNKEWNIFKNLYISAKQQIEQKRDDKITLDPLFNDLGYNGCIGNTSFNPATSGMLNFSNYWSSQYFNPQQPCYYGTAALYGSKAKRYVNATDISNLGNQNSAGLQNYLQTGQCPIATDLQNFLSGMAYTTKLSTTVSEYLYNHPEFSLNMYNTLAGTSSTQINYYWIASVSGNVLTGKIVNPNTNGFCTTTLDKTGSGIVNWTDIVGFDQLGFTGISGGSSTFTITAKVQISPGNFIYKHISGTTSCFQLNDCKFQPVCNANAFAIDASNLMGALASNGNLSASNFTLNGNYTVLLTQTIANALGVPYPTPGNYIWNWPGGTTKYFELSNSNYPQKIRFTINSTAPIVTINATTLNNIKSFSGMVSNYQNLFKVTANDVNGVGLFVINGATDLINGGSTTGISMGDCQLPQSLNCQDQAVQITTDLGLLLKDVLLKKPYTGNIDLFSSTQMTNLIKSNLPAGITSTSSVDNNNSGTNNLPYYDTLTFNIPGCTLKLWERSRSTTPQLYFSQLTNFNGITITGNADAFGYFHNFYGIGSYAAGAAVKTDTIFGSTCLNLKNCISCGDGSPGIQNGGRVMNMHIGDPPIYVAYSNIVDKLNRAFDLAAENENFIHKMSVQQFPSIEFGKYLPSFEQFAQSYDPTIDSKAMVESVDTFMIQYGNYTNCSYEYERYRKVVTNFNKQSMAQRNIEPYHLAALSAEDFYNQELCDNTNSYFAYLKKISKKNEKPQSITEYAVKGNKKLLQQESGKKIYQKYKESFSALNKNQKSELAANYQAVSPEEIENKKLYASRNAVNFIRGWTEEINSQSSNSSGRIDALAPLAAPCTATYNATQGIINSYNASAYATAHHYTLTLYPDTTAALFTNAGYCNCAKTYQGYLGQYINAGANSTLPLPVSITHFPACDSYIPNTDTCLSAYSGYTHAIDLYNRNHKPQITPYSYTTFKDSGYCNCAAGYAAYLNGISNGTVNDPNASQNTNIANFCKDTPPPCNKPPFADTLTSPTIHYQNPCVQQMINQALANAQNSYNQYIDSLTTFISNAYTQHCLHAFESYTAKYADKEYHFTLYYYDQAGNLIKTVPPEGVEKLNIHSYLDATEQKILADRSNNTQTVFTQHRLPTIYEYNSLNQLIRQNIPDHDVMTITEYDLPNGLDNRIKITATQFVNTNKGFLTGYITMPNGTLRGYLYTTDDGGQNWKRMYDFISADLQKVQMVNQRVGFASGSLGVVMKTIDGGNSWDMITLYRNKFTEQINDLYFTDTLHGVLAGNNGKVLSTTNGNSFNLYVAPANGFATTDTITGLTAIGNTFYASAKNGAQGKMYFSTNTGQTWTLMNNISVSQNLYKVQYLTAAIAYAVGDDGVLLKKNAANSWQLVSTGLNKKILDIYFKDFLNGVAIVDNASNGYGTIWKTFNGGNTWIQMTTAPDQYTHFYEYDHPNGKAMAGGLNGLVSKVLLTTSPFGIINLNTVGLNPLPNINFVAAQPNVVSTQLNLSVVGIDKLTQKMLVAVNGEDAFQNWFSVNAVPTLNPPTGNLQKVILQAGGGLDRILGVVLYQTGEVYVMFKPASVQTFTFMPVIALSPGVQISEIQRQGANSYIAFDKVAGKLFKFTVTSNGNSNPIISVLTPLLPLAPFTTINSMALTGTTNVLSIVGNSGQSAVYNPITPAWVVTTNKVLPINLNDISNNTQTNNYTVGKDGTVWTCVACTTSNSWKLLNRPNNNEYNSVTINSNFGDPGLLSTTNGKLYKHTVFGSMLNVINIPLTQAGVVKDVALSSTNEAYLATTSGKVIHFNNISFPTQINTAPVANGYQVNGISFTPVTNNVVGVGTNSGVFAYYGNNAARMKELFTNVLRDVHFTDINNGYVVGDSGVIRHTANSGAKWSLILPDLGAGPPSLITRLNPSRVWTTSQDVALMIGKNNYVAQINNTSSPFTIPVPGILVKDFRGIKFNHPNFGVIVGTKGVTYQVTPSGNTFSISGIAYFNTNPTTLIDINDVHVFNDNSFISVGTKGAIAYFNSSIGVYKPLNSYPAYSYSQIGTTNQIVFNDVFFHDDRTGYVVGDQGIALKCNLAQNIQTQVTVTSPPSVVPWDTLALSDRFGIFNNSTKALIDIKTIDFVTRYDGFVGGNFNDGRLRANYSMLIHDEGGYFSTRFWYDRLGRLTISQNTKQKNLNAYSYTKYDPLGRITEVGQKTDNSGTQPKFTNIFGTYINNYLNLNAIDDGKLNNWISANTGSRKEVTKTYYDTQAVVKPIILVQQNLRKRVASITYEDVFDGIDTTFQHATHYSYDVHGNVNTLIQQNPSAGSGQNFKRLDYNYDLISGKVNEISYQRDQADQFYHKYNYDSDNRITEVYTSKDSLIWDRDAHYIYYAHGHLARVELGDDDIQGIDYAYTLQGWIKGVNNEVLDPANDMGKDGQRKTGNPNARFARDAFGYTLSYFDNDYNAIGANWRKDTVHRFAAPQGGSDIQNARHSLFNGNISSMVTSIDNPALKVVMAQGNAYLYDQLHRIVQSKSFTDLESVQNVWVNTSYYVGSYMNTFSYDASGNILKQNRHNALGTVFDSLTYHYQHEGTGKLIRNRLYHVNDKAAGSIMTDDIKDQGVYDSTATSINFDNNYGYDEIGQLVKDSSEQIHRIEWSVYNKVRKIIRQANSTKPDLQFDYDATGNRIAKIVKPHGTSIENGGFDSTARWAYTYYVRDAQGNILVNYNKKATGSTLSYKLTERNLYGSLRLGVDNVNIEMISALLPSNTDSTGRILGKKQFELENHLGNVIATVSDKKMARNPRTIDVTKCTPDIAQTGIDNFGRMKIQPLIQFAGVNFPFKTKVGDQYRIDFYIDIGNTNPDSIAGDWLAASVANSTSFFNNDITHTGHYSQTFTATDTLYFWKPLFYNQGNTPNDYFFVDSLKITDLNSTNDTVRSYVAEYRSVTDYAVFGAPMDQRTWHANSFDYGTNGKMKDDEISGEGNSYEFGDRLYDPRLGRFLSIDKMAEKNPHESPYVFAGDNPVAFIDIDGDLKGNPPGVEIHGKTVIVSFTYKDVDYKMKFKVNKPQEFKLKNLKTGESGKFNFYSAETKKQGANPNSMDLFVNTMTVTKKNRNQGGAKDLMKLDKVILGAKFIDLINAALKQNPDFKVGIVGNVAVHDPEGGFDFDKKGYNFTDQEDKKDIGKFTQRRADNLKKDFFDDKENVETYGIKNVPAEDVSNLKLSGENKDANGATIYLKAKKSTTTSTPSF